MPKAWIRTKAPEFVRDVLRDFCIASRVLETEFRRFDAAGHVDFTVIRDLLGLEMNKGLMWRLKDTAHHLFREYPESPASGKFLDWGIGYIFHELMKLKEDAYQEQTYAPALHYMKDTELSDFMRSISEELAPVLDQTHESIRREITRVRFIMRYCRKIFTFYLAEHEENQLLARFLFKQYDLVREVFGEEHEELIRAIYKDCPGRMYALAARSLREGGWYKEAKRALDEAVRLSLDGDCVNEELESLRALLP